MRRCSERRQRGRFRTPVKSRMSRSGSSASRPRSRCWRRCCCWSGSRRSSSPPGRTRRTRNGRAGSGLLQGARLVYAEVAARAAPDAVPRRPSRHRRRRGGGGAADRSRRRRAVRRHVVHVPVQAALDLAAERPLRRRVGQRVRRPVGGGLPLRLGRHLPVRPRRRRVHHDHDEDRGDPDRHRPAGAALPSQRLDPDRDPDARVRARRHLLRHVGGDARLLRPARAARAGAALGPDGGGRDHLPRRRLRRDRVDREPVLDRRRLGRGRDQHRRRDRAADRALGRARDARDRLRDLVCAPRPAASGEVRRRRLAGRRRAGGGPRQRRARR